MRHILYHGWKVFLVLVVILGLLWRDTDIFPERIAPYLIMLITILGLFSYIFYCRNVKNPLNDMAWYRALKTLFVIISICLFGMAVYFSSAYFPGAIDLNHSYANCNGDIFSFKDIEKENSEFNIDSFRKNLND